MNYADAGMVYTRENIHGGAMTLIEQVKYLSYKGMSREEIAAQIGVSKGWVDMLMDTDAFSVVKVVDAGEKGDERA
jgi:orotate phosphoribosyltransferase-like protein